MLRRSAAIKRGATLLVGVFSLVELVQGAPTAVSLLAEIGLEGSRIIGPLLVGLVLFAAVLLFAGPERVKGWRAEVRAHFTSPSNPKSGHGTPRKGASVEGAAYKGPPLPLAFRATTHAKSEDAELLEQARHRKTRLAAQERVLAKPADRGEADAPKPIPPQHAALLHQLLDGAITSIERDQQYRFDEESVVGRSHELILWAHFPELGKRVEAWNTRLYARDAPRSQLGAHAMHAAGQRGLLVQGIIVDRAVALMRDRTLRFVDDKDARPVDWSWVQDLPSMASLMADGERIAMFPTLPTTAEREVLIAGFDALIAEMREWGDVQAISEAERQSVLYTDKQPLLADLRRERKVERFFEAQGCDLCRRNRGEPAIGTMVVNVSRRVDEPAV